MADGNQLAVVGSGAVRLKAKNGSRVMLTQVLHAPGRVKRLISVAALTEKGVEGHFKSNICVISHQGKVLIQVPRVAKSYTVHTEAANRVYEHAKANVEVRSRDGGDPGDIFGDAQRAHQVHPH
ncbi:hypothetical protein PINS_up011721 [Pythium insidiosum]|nr:hypothetical protein PINS_up011721 [Pythium insidiosum]